jgi:primosomal replication protein N
MPSAGEGIIGEKTMDKGTKGGGTNLAAKFKPFDWSGSRSTNREPVAEESWRRSGSRVSEALRAHGIVQTDTTGIESFSLQGDDWEIRSDVIIEVGQEADEPGFDRLCAYEVWTRRAGKDAKRVTRQENVFGTEVSVCGYIASPFEPRMLVAVLEKRYIFEGVSLLLRL